MKLRYVTLEFEVELDDDVNIYDYIHSVVLDSQEILNGEIVDVSSRSLE